MVAPVSKIASVNDPQAGADFHDMIGSGHSRLAYDTTDRAGVDDEVLPEFLGGADAGIGRDTTDIGGT